MILKHTDDKFPQIAKLQALLNTHRVPSDKVPFVEKDIRIMESGIKGEKDSAYLIDFYLCDSKRTAVIHDLRLELPDGRVAQIDHLLIHDTYRFYVLETKNFSHGIKITDEGEFLRWNDWKKTYEGIPSPIAQNERHALVLTKVLEAIGLPPPTVRSMILISPSARIDRSKKFDSSMVVKADQFLGALEQDLADSGILKLLGGLVKSSRNGAVEEIGRKLISLHRPAKVDLLARYGLSQWLPPGKAEAAAVDCSPHKAETNKAGPSTDGGVNMSAAAPPQAIPQATAPCTHLCKKCGGKQLSIQYGYNYHFKCGDCGHSMPIKVQCPKCGAPARIRKSKQQFFLECGKCGNSELYFTNPPA